LLLLLTYPQWIHTASFVQTPKNSKNLFSINSAIIWVNSILGNWYYSSSLSLLLPLPFPPPSQNSIADQEAISCPGRQRQKGPGEKKKQSIIYIQHLTDTPNQKCPFLAPNHQGACFVGGGVEEANPTPPLFLSFIQSTRGFPKGHT
jgi:hypothetical protein